MSPMSCHCGAEVTGYHLMSCDHYKAPSYAEEQLQHLEEKRAMSGIEVSAMAEKPSKVQELIHRLHAEAERQQYAVDGLYKVTNSVVYYYPDKVSEPSDARPAEVPSDSELVVNLRNILLSFERNTNRITSLADGIEL